MTRKGQVSLSKFELEIMEILWKLGESSVREVQEAIQERQRPAYTTVQTIFARLEEKRAVRRTRKIGNAFLSSRSSRALRCTGASSTTSSISLAGPASPWWPGCWRQASSRWRT